PFFVEGAAGSCAAATARPRCAAQRKATSREPIMDRSSRWTGRISRRQTPTGLIDCVTVPHDTEAMRFQTANRASGRGLPSKSKTENPKSKIPSLPAILGGPPLRPAGPPDWPGPNAAVADAIAQALADGSWGKYHGPRVGELTELLAEAHHVSH